MIVLCVVFASVGSAPARATFMTLDGEVAVLETTEVKDIGWSL